MLRHAIPLALLAPVLGCAATPEPAPETRIQHAPAQAEAKQEGANEQAARDDPQNARDKAEVAGDAIIVCGQPYATGTRVVTWLEEGGYNAYLRHRWGDPETVLPRKPAAGCNTPSRLGTGRALSPEAAALHRARGAGTVGLETLQTQVTQFVVHYDVAYTSANCFHILHDVRGLSVHFMLDLDGTIYQTCDLRERARHAGSQNDRSVGIEIAHPGPLTGQPALAARYPKDAKGPYLELPAWLPRGRLGDYRARPSRKEPVQGRIHGRKLSQYDFTDAQYEALAKLVAALRRALPKIEIDAPRGPGGRVTWDVLPPTDLARFQGLIGHYHVTRRKVDPGPAFDWKRLLTAARQEHARGVQSARAPEEKEPAGVELIDPLEDR